MNWLLVIASLLILESMLQSNLRLMLQLLQLMLLEIIQNLNLNIKTVIKVSEAEVLLLHGHPHSILEH